MRTSPDSSTIILLNKISKELFPWLSSRDVRSLRLQFLSDLAKYQIESSHEFEDWNLVRQMKASDIANLMEKSYGRCFTTGNK